MGNQPTQSPVDNNVESDDPTASPIQTPTKSSSDVPTLSPSNNSDESERNTQSNDSAIGMYIGIAVGCICLLLCIVVIFVYYHKKKMQRDQEMTTQSAPSLGSNSPISNYDGPPPPEVKVQTHFDDGKFHTFKQQNINNQYHQSDIPAIPMTLPSNTGLSDDSKPNSSMIGVSLADSNNMHQQHGMNDDDDGNSSDDDTVYKLQTKYAQEEIRSNGKKSTMADIDELRSNSIASDNTTLYNLQNQYLNQKSEGNDESTRYI